MDVAYLSTSEPITAERPTRELPPRVWPERDALGRVVIWQGNADTAEPVLAIGLAGEDTTWLAAWLRALAAAVESVDR